LKDCDYVYCVLLVKKINKRNGTLLSYDYIKVIRNLTVVVLNLILLYNCLLFMLINRVKIHL